MIEQLNPDSLLVAPVVGIALFHFVQSWREPQWRHSLSSDAPPPGARLKLFRESMTTLWILAAICVACWLFSGRELTGLGFRLPEPGWRGWLAWAAAGIAATYLMVWVPVALALSRKERVKSRDMIRSVEGVDLIRPRAQAEHRLFTWLAVTAGITEEIIYRGFLIGAAALMMPVWAAALVSVVIFTAAHFYQGLAGLARVLPMGALLAGVFVLGGSLWPVIMIHIAADLSGGAVFRILDSFAEEDQPADLAEPSR